MSKTLHWTSAQNGYGQAVIVGDNEEIEGQAVIFESDQGFEVFFKAKPIGIAENITEAKRLAKAIANGEVYILGDPNDDDGDEEPNLTAEADEDATGDSGI